MDIDSDIRESQHRAPGIFVWWVLFIIALGVTPLFFHFRRVERQPGEIPLATNEFMVASTSPTDYGALNVPPLSAPDNIVMLCDCHSPDDDKKYGSGQREHRAVWDYYAGKLLWCCNTCDLLRPDDPRVNQ